MRTDKQLNKNIFFSLCLFPLANICVVLFAGNGIELHSSMLIEEQLIIYMLIAFAEELFFRGLVLYELVFSYNWPKVKASLMVSLLFGILHLSNINSYASCQYAFIQSICAFAVSVNVSAIFIKTKSLWWCVAIHSIINITSIFRNCNGNEQILALSYSEIVVFLLISFMYLINGIKILDDTWEVNK